MKVGVILLHYDRDWFLAHLLWLCEENRKRYKNERARA